MCFSSSWRETLQWKLWMGPNHPNKIKHLKTNFCVARLNELKLFGLREQDTWEGSFHSLRGGYTEDSNQLFSVSTDDRARRNRLKVSVEGKITYRRVLRRKIVCDWRRWLKCCLLRLSGCVLASVCSNLLISKTG